MNLSPHIDISVFADTLYSTVNASEDRINWHTTDGTKQHNYI